MLILQNSFYHSFNGFYKQITYFCSMKKFLSLLFILLLMAINPLMAQQLHINEFMSSNTTTLQDADGDYPDWIELFNSGNESINLEAFMISDDTLVPEKWIFPSITLMPDSFLVVFASDKDRYDTTELHTNFKIKSEGEYLILSNPDAIEIDRTDPVELASDMSYGCYPDGSDDLMVLGNPTPGTANVSGASILNFSAQAGYYTSSLKLGISSTNPNDVIYFSTDGSFPNQNSILYADSIPLDFIDPLPNHYANIPTTPDPMHDHFRKWTPPEGPVPKANVIRAVTYRDGAQQSTIYTNTYFVDPNMTEKYPYHIISITTDSINLFGFDEGIYVPGVFFDSTNTDWTGNYYQKGDDWERPIHFEYFDEDGNRAVNQDAGMRIHGKITRHAAQKSLRIYARSEYGKSYFNYPFMMNTDQDEFKRLILRTTYADGSQTIIKDLTITDQVLEYDLDLTHYRPVAVFIDGEYWGTHSVRERIDKYYISSLYGVNPDSLDLLENNMTVIEGSTNDYQNMIDYIDANDLANDEHYEYIKTRMDVDNYVDYLIVQLYFGNIDWPGSNTKYWREQKEGAKWRWILFDLDNTCFDYTFNSLDYATFEGDTSWQNPSWATFLFRNLLKNENFETQFLERFAYHLNHSLQTDSMLNQIDEFTALYGQMIEMHIQRYNFPRSPEGWVGDIAWVLKQFVDMRPCAMTEFILEYFEMNPEEFGFICDTGIGDIATGLIVYPNPVRTITKIKIYNWLDDKAQFRMYNETGQTIMEMPLNVSDGKILDRINLSGLKPGMYFLRIWGNEQSVVTKLIKTAE